MVKNSFSGRIDKFGDLMIWRFSDLIVDAIIFAKIIFACSLSKAFGKFGNEEKRLYFSRKLSGGI